MILVFACRFSIGQCERTVCCLSISVALLLFSLTFQHVSFAPFSLISFRPPTPPPFQGGQAPEREYRDAALDGGAPFAYRGVEYDVVTQEPGRLRRQWPAAPEFPTDEEQSRLFQEGLRELLDGYDVGEFGEERFNLWAAKNPFLRPSFVRHLFTVPDLM